MNRPKYVMNRPYGKFFFRGLFNSLPRFPFCKRVSSEKKNAPTRVRFSWFYILFSYNLFIIHAVIRSFLGDMDIMRMALLQGCSGDLHKSAGLLQSLDILCTAVAHTGTEAAE